MTSRAFLVFRKSKVDCNGVFPFEGATVSLAESEVSYNPHYLAVG